MAKPQSKQTSWLRTPVALYGAVLGAAVGTAVVMWRTQYAAWLLAGLMIIAAYTFFVSYQKATSRKWSPRHAFAPAPVLGALVVGVMAVSGAQYLGSSHANELYQAKNNHIGSGGGASGIGNIGSIVKVDGGGTCDANDIMHGISGLGNIGSIIIVDNACGDVSKAKANFNIGSIVKVTSTGPCKKDEPTTVVVQPVTPTPTPAPAAPVAKAAELPATGPANIVIIALIAAVTGYLFSALYRLKTGGQARR